MVCSGNLDTAADDCRNGTCKSCGFHLWSGKDGVRKSVVGPDGNILPNAPALWKTVIRWERMKSGKGGASTAVEGSQHSENGGKEALRQERQGSIAAFFDEFAERVARKAVKHRHTRLRAAMAAKECRQNLWPLMLLSDYDWAENGVLELARQIQSEYWALVAYSLFISITSFLDLSKWLDCSSTLPHKAEVTVEPEGASPPTAEPAVGSFFATVVEGDSERGYKLIDAKGIDVPGRISRARLRHRVWQTTCACL